MSAQSRKSTENSRRLSAVWKNEEYSLSLMLEIYGAPLAEPQLWALIYQSAVKLKSVLEKGQGREAEQLVLNPDTLIVSGNGSVRFQRVFNKKLLPHEEEQFFAPDDVRRDPSAASPFLLGLLEKAHVYALGATAWHAADYKLAEDEEPCLGQALTSLIEGMTEDGATDRCTVQDVIDRCEAHLDETDADYLVVCCELVQEVYQMDNVLNKWLHAGKGQEEELDKTELHIGVWKKLASEIAMGVPLRKVSGPGYSSKPSTDIPPSLRDALRAEIENGAQLLKDSHQRQLRPLVETLTPRERLLRDLTAERKLNPVLPPEKRQSLGDLTEASDQPVPKKKLTADHITLDLMLGAMDTSGNNRDEDTVMGDASQRPFGSKQMTRMNENAFANRQGLFFLGAPPASDESADSIPSSASQASPPRASNRNLAGLRKSSLPRSGSPNVLDSPMMRAAPIPQSAPIQPVPRFGPAHPPAQTNEPLPAPMMHDSDDLTQEHNPNQLSPHLGTSDSENSKYAPKMKTIDLRMARKMSDMQTSYQGARGSTASNEEIDLSPLEALAQLTLSTSGKKPDHRKSRRSDSALPAYGGSAFGGASSVGSLTGQRPGPNRLVNSTSSLRANSMDYVGAGSMPTSPAIGSGFSGRPETATVATRQFSLDRGTTAYGMGMGRPSAATEMQEIARRRMFGSAGGYGGGGGGFIQPLPSSPSQQQPAYGAGGFVRNLNSPGGSGYGGLSRSDHSISGAQPSARSLSGGYTFGQTQQNRPESAFAGFGQRPDIFYGVFGKPARTEGTLNKFGTSPSSSPHYQSDPGHLAGGGSDLTKTPSIQSQNSATHGSDRRRHKDRFDPTKRTGNEHVLGRTLSNADSGDLTGRSPMLGNVASGEIGFGSPSDSFLSAPAAPSKPQMVTIPLAELERLQRQHQLPPEEPAVPQRPTAPMYSPFDTPAKKQGQIRLRDGPIVRLDEARHIAQVHTKSCLEELQEDNPKVYKDVIAKRLCWVCQIKTFGWLFGKGTTCYLCLQRICTQCQDATQLGTEQAVVVCKRCRDTILMTSAVEEAQRRGTL